MMRIRNRVYLTYIEKKKFFNYYNNNIIYAYIYTYV